MVRVARVQHDDHSRLRPTGHFEHSGPACDRHDRGARIILLSAVRRDDGEKGATCRLSQWRP